MFSRGTTLSGCHFGWAVLLSFSTAARASLSPPSALIAMYGSVVRAAVPGLFTE
jgi:hypothetical protein